MNKSKKMQFTRRANGEGSVYQMKDGRIGAAISLGKDANGKRLRHVETGKTEQDAIQKMQLWLFQNGYMGQQTVVINGQTTVEEFVEDFRLRSLMGSGISDRTFENYSYALKHFQDYFRGQRIGTIASEEMKRFFAWMVNYEENGQYKYSQVTLDRTVYVVNRMFKRAVNKGYLSSNPMGDPDFKKPISKKGVKHPKALSNEELIILKKALEGNQVVYPVIALMAITGMRTQEALGLQWGDVDFENNVIHIQRAITKKFDWDAHGNKIASKTVLGPTKNPYSNRELVVPEEVIKLLLDWREIAPEVSKTKLGQNDCIFGNRKCSNWTYAGFRASIKHMLKKSNLGMDNLRLHRLRHTVATEMSNRPNANVYELMQLLGHGDIRTAKEYIDAETRDRAEKNKEFMKHLSAKSGLFGVKKDVAPKEENEGLEEGKAS